MQQAATNPPGTRAGRPGRDRLAAREHPIERGADDARRVRRGTHRAPGNHAVRPYENRALRAELAPANEREARIEPVTFRMPEAHGFQLDAARARRGLAGLTPGVAVLAGDQREASGRRDLPQ